MGLLWKLITAADEEGSKRVVAKALFDYFSGKKDDEKKTSWRDQGRKEAEKSSWPFGKSSQTEKKSWFK